MQKRIIALVLGVLAGVTPQFGDITSAAVGGGYTAPVPLTVAPSQIGQTSFDGDAIFVSSSATPPQSNWDVRGKITRIVAADDLARQKGILGSFLVEGSVDPDTTLDKAAVTVTTSTQVFDQQGHDRRPSAFGSLKAGQTVQVRFAGPATQSYPVQAKASEIVIVH